MDDSGNHSLGPVLADGTTVTGDTVNLCAKVTATIQPGEIRVTKSAFANSRIAIIFSASRLASFQSL